MQRLDAPRSWAQTPSLPSSCPWIHLSHSWICTYKPLRPHRTPVAGTEWCAHTRRLTLLRVRVRNGAPWEDRTDWADLVQGMARSTHWLALCTCKLTILSIYPSVFPCFHYHNESYAILKKPYPASQNVPLTPSSDTLHLGDALQSCFWWPTWDGCPPAYGSGAVLGQDRGLFPWMEY